MMENKKYTIAVNKIRNDERVFCVTRTLVVFAFNNKEAIERAKDLDNDSWDNYFIKKIEEVRLKL